MTTKCIHRIAVIVICTIFSYSSFAESTYPSRTITVVAPYAAGGATDFVARYFSEKLSKELDIPVVVANRPGANGIVGTSSVARSEPDGYTLLVSQASTMSLNPVLYSQTNYDPDADFQPISPLAEYGNVLGVSKESGIANFAAFLERSKTDEKTLTYATGASSHFVTALMLQRAAGIRMEEVRYKGTGPALPDVISGRVDSIFFTPLSAKSQEDKITLISISSQRRNPSLPDVPSIEELGFPQAVVSDWYALEAPANTPDHIVKKLYDAVAGLLERQEIKRDLHEKGFVELSSNSPSEFAEFKRSELTKWKTILKEAGVEME